MGWGRGRGEEKIRKKTGDGREEKKNKRKKTEKGEFMDVSEARHTKTIKRH